MKNIIYPSPYILFVSFLYIIVLGWWLRLQFLDLTATPEANLYNWFYGLIGLSATLYGFYIAHKKWGGFKSLIGKGLKFLSIGLLGQWLGLQVWTYYNLIMKVEVPYPSLADLGYISLVPAYTAAACCFALAAGAKFSLKTYIGKVIAVIIPLTILAISYFLLIKNIGFDSTNLLKLLLDYGYPLGEIIPVSVALFTLLTIHGLAGSIMRGKILYLIGAFFIQFIAEYVFLFMAGNGSYVNGGLTDILYPTSYFVMAIGIASFSKYE